MKERTKYRLVLSLYFLCVAALIFAALGGISCIVYYSIHPENSIYLWGRCVERWFEDCDYATKQQFKIQKGVVPTPGGRCPKCLGVIEWSVNEKDPAP